MNPPVTRSPTGLVARPALEFETILNFQDDARFTTNLGTASGDLDICTLTLNPLMRFPNVRPVCPLSRRRLRGGFVDLTNTRIGAVTYKDTEAIVLTLQAIAGVDFNIYGGLSVFAEYKYLYLANMDFTYGTAAVDRLEFSNWSQHMIGGGVRYKF
jgi:opacity protein-like surface antigen